MAADNTQLFEKHGIKILSPQHPSIQALLAQNLEPVMHGDKVWDSTYVMMDYFTASPPPVGARLMDVGCGWGLLSVFAAKKLGMEVIAVDADSDVLRSEERRVGKVCRTRWWLNQL